MKEVKRGGRRGVKEANKQVRRMKDGINIMKERKSLK